MPDSGSRSVDDYIARQPEGARSVLERLRQAIRKTLPDADEVISYGIPAYKQKGKAVIYFGGWKRHYSLYPAGERLLAAFGKDVARYEIRKGTIRLPLDEAVPVALIQRIVRFRAREVAEAGEPDGAAAPTRTPAARRTKA